jgi:hypothetical protein
MEISRQFNSKNQQYAPNFGAIGMHFPRTMEKETIQSILVILNKYSENGEIKALKGITDLNKPANYFILGSEAAEKKAVKELRCLQARTTDTKTHPISKGITIVFSLLSGFWAASTKGFFSNGKLKYFSEIWQTSDKKALKDITRYKKFK